MTSASWSPSSWRGFPALQQPDWPDQARARGGPRGDHEDAAARLRRRGAAACSTRLADVVEGRAFLLQAGDCAESFYDWNAPNLREKLKIILQMSAVLTYAASLPVVKVGRIAGQFVKPRSEPTETVGDLVLPTFRGHIVHSDEPTVEARTPDPGADAPGLPPGRVDAEPAARVHEGRLRRPRPGPRLDAGVRRQLARRAAATSSSRRRSSGR